jgi:hypothetical protein
VFAQEAVPPAGAISIRDESKERPLVAVRHEMDIHDG